MALSLTEVTLLAVFAQLCTENSSRLLREFVTDAAAFDGVSFASTRMVAAAAKQTKVLAVLSLQTSSSSKMQETVQGLAAAS
jgi:hypothetical protein